MFELLQLVLRTSLAARISSRSRFMFAFLLELQLQLLNVQAATPGLSPDNHWLKPIQNANELIPIRSSSVKEDKAWAFSNLPDSLYLVNSNAEQTRSNVLPPGSQIVYDQEGDGNTSFWAIVKSADGYSLYQFTTNEEAHRRSEPIILPPGETIWEIAVADSAVRVLAYFEPHDEVSILALDVADSHLAKWIPSPIHGFAVFATLAPGVTDLSIFADPRPDRSHYYVFRREEGQFFPLPISISPRVSGMGRLFVFSKSSKRLFFIPSDDGDHGNGLITSTLPAPSTPANTRMLLEGVPINSIESSEDGRYVVAIPTDEKGIYVIDPSTEDVHVRYLLVSHNNPDRSVPDLEWNRLASPNTKRFWTKLKNDIVAFNLESPDGTSFDPVIQNENVGCWGTEFGVTVIDSNLSQVHLVDKEGRVLNKGKTFRIAGPPWDVKLYMFGKHHAILAGNQLSLADENWNELTSPRELQLEHVEEVFPAPDGTHLWTSDVSLTNFSVPDIRKIREGHLTRIYYDDSGKIALGKDFSRAVRSIYPSYFGWDWVRASNGVFVLHNGISVSGEEPIHVDGIYEITPSPFDESAAWIRGNAGLQRLAVGQRAEPKMSLYIGNVEFQRRAKHIEAEVPSDAKARVNLSWPGDREVPDRSGHWILRITAEKEVKAEQTIERNGWDQDAAFSGEIPFGKPSTVSFEYWNDNTQFKYAWDDVRFIRRVQPQDRPWVRAVLAWLAILLILLVSKFRSIRESILRFLPIAIGGASAFCAAFLHQGEFNKPLFFALLAATVPGLVTFGLIQPSVLRYLSDVTPLDALLAILLRWPLLRKRTFAGYCKELKALLAKMREIANHEQYVSLPVRLIVPQSSELILSPEIWLKDCLLLKDEGGNILVESPGGRGKSALVREIVSRLLDEFSKTGRCPLPVLCENKDVNDKEPSLSSSESGDTGSAPVSKDDGGKQKSKNNILLNRVRVGLEPHNLADSVLRTQLESGDFLIVIDGLAETGLQANDLEGFLRSEAASKTRMLLAARPEENRDPNADAYRTICLMSRHRFLVVEPQSLEGEVFRRFLGSYIISDGLLGIEESNADDTKNKRRQVETSDAGSGGDEPVNNLPIEVIDAWTDKLAVCKSKHDGTYLPILVRLAMDV